MSAHAAYELHELEYRATKAGSPADFLDSLNSSKELSESFKRLRKEWHWCSEHEAFELLKRIKVKTVDEGSLHRWMTKSLDYLVIGDTDEVGDILLSLAQKSVDRELISIDIWHYLQRKGIKRRSLRNDTHALVELDRANKSYKSTFDDNNIKGEIIPREEADTILARLNSEDKSSASTPLLLTGPSGYGKSAILLQVLDSLIEHGVPVLALRLDRYLSARSPEQLGKLLDLRGSPLNVLAEIAQGRNYVLILDQFEAVGSSNKSQALPDCIRELIAETEKHPNLRILVACNRFSLHDDTSVKKLINRIAVKETISANKLSFDSVNHIISTFRPDIRLTNATKQFLSIPLHLHLFIEVEDESDGSYITNTSSLFEVLWKYKKKILHTSHGCSERTFVTIMNIFADYLSDELSALVPEEKFEECEYCTKKLAQEGLLVRQGKGYSLFHESFSNFVLARQFFGRKRDFIVYVQEEGYYLSHRPQIRGLLLFDRDLHSERYISSIDFLLSNSDIPFHVKQLIFDMLASFDDPTIEECNIITHIIDDTANIYSDYAWNVLRRSIFWFDEIDSLGWIEKWANNERLADQVVMLLPDVAKERPHRVVELLRPFISSSEWNIRLTNLIPRIDFSVDYGLFNILLQLINNGALDLALKSEGYDYVSHILTPLSDKQPKWACQVVGNYLDRWLHLSVKAGQSNPFEFNRTVLPKPHQDDFLEKCALSAPLEFVLKVFPFMYNVMHLTVNENISRKNAELFRDPVWSFRHYKGGCKNSDVLLAAMETAFCEMAVKQPHEFTDMALELQQLSFETVQYLLVRGYQANGQALAEEAARYLCARQEHFKIGYIGNPYWATKELLEAITPYCSRESLSQIEHRVMNYCSDQKSSGQCDGSEDYAQFVLLNGIKPARRSIAARTRLKALRITFGDESPEPPTAKGGYVQSPVPEEVAATLTNQEWLEALHSYDSDTRTFSGDNVIGGAYQLSSVLESQARKDPQRFAQLAFMLPDDINPHYYKAVLRGVAKTDLDPALRIELCKHCHNVADKPYGREICHVFSNFGTAPLSSEALTILAWYAIQDPDPSKEWWREEASVGEYHYGGDVFTAGMNSVRGSAALAIADIIRNDKDRCSYAKCQPHLIQTIEKICADVSVAVRSCAVEILRQLSVYDATQTLHYFFTVIKKDNILLGTYPTIQFLNGLWESHFDELEPIFLRMIDSELENVVTLGAQFLRLIALFIKEGYPLVQNCLSSSDAAKRAGVADMCAKYLLKARHGSFCEEALTQLFVDSDPDVRYKAATCFTHLKDQELVSVEKVTEAFVKSRDAFKENYRLLMRALVRSTAKLPSITIEVCSRFLEIEGENCLDVTKEAFAAARSAVKLAFRGYQENKGNINTRNSYQELINTMLQMGVYGVERELAKFEISNSYIPY